jgi:hypothetical protein
MADKYGLIACIAPEYISEDSDEASLVIGYKNNSKAILLEVLFENGWFVIDKHRTNELTDKFRGRHVTADWIENFIRHNSVENHSEQNSKAPTLAEYSAMPLEERARLNGLTPSQTLRLEEIQEDCRASTAALADSTKPEPVLRKAQLLPTPRD